jgi:hypothetical protein
MSLVPIYKTVGKVTLLQIWTLGLQEIETPRISRQSAHEGGKGVSPTYLLSLPPRRYPWYSFMSEALSIPGPQCGQKD